jgi:FixJ family two-component response regulator
MAEKILLVDDDGHVLDGYRRSLSREFEIETALGGEPALRLAKVNGPYAVVVSDMRMPGMDGIQFLSRIKALSPDTIRVMLTGNADMETAVHAINEGSIFRFLNKPCSKEEMAKTLTAALVQYRLVTAEKQLLEQTLSGSLQVLTEVLSMVNPAAFSRAERARRYIHHVVTSMKLGNPWQYEIAAMLSQLGCVTLAPETIDAVYSGKKLSPSEQEQYDSHPNVALCFAFKNSTYGTDRLDDPAPEPAGGAERAIRDGGHAAGSRNPPVNSGVRAGDPQRSFPHRGGACAGSPEYQVQSGVFRGPGDPGPERGRRGNPKDPHRRAFGGHDHSARGSHV